MKIPPGTIIISAVCLALASALLFFRYSIQTINFTASDEIYRVCLVRSDRLTGQVSFSAVTAFGGATEWKPIAIWHDPSPAKTAEEFLNEPDKSTPSASKGFKWLASKPSLLARIWNLIASVLEFFTSAMGLLIIAGCLVWSVRPRKNLSP